MLTTMKDIMKLKLEKGFGFTLSMLDRIRSEANPIIHFPVVHSHYFSRPDSLAQSATHRQECKGIAKNVGLHSIVPGLPLCLIVFEPCIVPFSENIPFHSGNQFCDY